jgi:hypothetical protein
MEERTYIVKVEFHAALAEEYPEVAYLAFVDCDEYRATIVTAPSIWECLSELSTSIRIIDQYRRVVGEETDTEKIRLLLKENPLPNTDNNSIKQ